jgi:transposase InsO family protein
MPWKETCPMDERIEFVGGYLREAVPFTDLCAEVGISRKTGYKWIRRYEGEGPAGLIERSRARHSQAHRTPSDQVERLIQLRRQYHWGPRKLKDRAETLWPDEHWPAASTIGTILCCKGLVKPRRKPRPKATPSPHPLIEPQAPNELWTIDFKGQFRLGNRRFCFPLTLVDDYSRFILRCDGVSRVSREQILPSLRAAFRCYGMPQAIRSDNGPPFATNGIAGLSKLGIWWKKLGIHQERIHPGHPEENGRHERMHRSLKAEVLHVIQPTMHQQQRAFDRWRSDFNEIRPHEGLDDRKPAQVYERSTRGFSRAEQPASYPADYAIRQVRQNGSIKWHSKLIFVSSALAGEPLGLKQIDEHRWSVFFTDLKIGMMDTELMKVLPM